MNIELQSILGVIMLGIINNKIANLPCSLRYNLNCFAVEYENHKLETTKDKL